jgi:hypothetical protein
LVERALREIRGEGRLPPSTIQDIYSRGNEWIQELLDASDNAAAQAKAKGKAKPKGKAKSKAEDPLEAEPKHATLEAALQAAKDCKKCEMLKDGSKRCRACVGEQFEAVRQKGFLARAAEEFEGKVMNI